ncbi:hypothetical protein B5F76_13485 [Desulfovibrio sp. An276]|uniref:glycosyltransferase family 2 protein n=1 Tax=Desulfovibrio sp. An276 TaxID=1965618 RepID=UPI000B37F4B9|nr:glycosyltransferase family 2 protein [Desulfovibrio sp. An276]OUO49628.1 hypothetical protein B5F76_13485 [Desulfovibrio sp. An276]
MNKEKPLISLITPCYNGGGYIKPYIEGILSQTYSNVQYIFINDGSIDNTESIILSYKNKIIEKGWEFIYIKHESNLGQSAAINHALVKVKGKYFSQIDSDDIIYPDFLERYCDFLETHNEYKFCYAKIAIANEDSPYSPNRIQFREIDKSNNSLFEDLIKNNNIPPYPFYMIHTESFLSVVKLPVYENRGGQNWQILLPMAYHYQCGFIDKVLATYIIRSNSHSRENKNILDRHNSLKRILYNTISRINMPDGEKHYYYDMIINYFLSKQTIIYRLFKIPFLKIEDRKIYLFKKFKIGRIV